MLGSINLAEFVYDQSFNFDRLRAVVGIAVRALNDVLDEGLPLHPLEEQRTSVAKWRQIGLGIMGLADCLIKLGIPYGSTDSLCICNAIASTIANQAMQASAMLAKEKGAYDGYNGSSVLTTEYFTSVAYEDTRELVETYGLRNSQLLTCAPTGSLSTMLGISGGIEPIYANYYTRKTESLHGKGVEYKVYTPIVREYMNTYGLVNESNLPNYFVTSHELEYTARINMQAVWQRCIDASISSTINLPNSATVEDVENVYLYAYEKGLKGVTIYRDGCSREGILQAIDEQEPNMGYGFTYDDLPRGAIIDADDDVIGLKRKLVTGCGTLHCTAFFDPATGDLLETYLSKGSTGGCNNSLTGLSRMISLAARGGIDIYSIVDQLQSAGVCPSYAVRKAVANDTSKGSSCPVAVANALLDMYKELQFQLSDDSKEVECVEEPYDADISVEEQPKPSCPECGEPIIFENGCSVCRACGWSKCS